MRPEIFALYLMGGAIPLLITIFIARRRGFGVKNSLLYVVSTAISVPLGLGLAVQITEVFPYISQLFLYPPILFGLTFTPALILYRHYGEEKTRYYIGVYLATVLLVALYGYLLLMVAAANFGAL